MKSLLLLALFLAGCAAAVTRPPPDPPDEKPVAAIYVVERGWHTDIGLPADQLTGPLATLRARFPGVRYLVFGFGERGYLESRSKDIGDMMLALLPSRALMLVTALNVPPEQAFPDKAVVKLPSTGPQYDRLSDFITAAFETAKDGRLHDVADGPYPGSLFYDAAGTYDAFHTCNTWTLEALESAGYDVHAGGVLFAGQVMDQVRRIAPAQIATD